VMALCEFYRRMRSPVHVKSKGLSPLIRQHMMLSFQA
jgi:hypothetical protein